MLFMRTKFFLTFTVFTVLTLQVSADVIKIHDFEELKKIGKHPDFPLDSNYELADNIDASDSRNMNDGKGFEPIGKLLYGTFRYYIPDSAFTGTFDGKGFVINNLYINRPAESNIGLFGFVGIGGIIKAIGLSNVSIIGDLYVGGLIGASSNGIVANCYSNGNVSGRGSVGGLVGSIFGGQITNCYSTGAVSGISYLGGLVGSITDDDSEINFSTITNCYSTGSVSGVGIIGGLVGIIITSGFTNVINSTITNCYSTGLVSGTGADIDGFIGVFFSDSEIVTNCYWDIETSGLTTSARGEGRTTTQMKQKTTYIGWDFDNIWAIDEGEDYPYLLALGKTQTPTSVIGNKIIRNATVAPVPLIIIKNKTLTIKSTPNSELQIRLFDMRGKTLFRFNTRGSAATVFH